MSTDSHYTTISFYQRLFIDFILTWKYFYIPFSRSMGLSHLYPLLPSPFSTYKWEREKKNVWNNITNWKKGHSYILKYLSEKYNQNNLKNHYSCWNIIKFFVTKHISTFIMNTKSNSLSSNSHNVFLFWFSPLTDGRNL